MTNEIVKSEENQQIQISKVGDRTKIVFKKAILQGKVKGADVLNTIMIAARMQSEKMIEKLQRGAPLDNDEIKSLKLLADIAKLDDHTPDSPTTHIQQQFIGMNSEDVKKSALNALLAKIPDPVR